MPVILRLFGSIFFFPAFQQTQVIAQHPKTFLLCLPVSHFLADFSFDDCLSWRTMTFAVKTDREILCQLQGSFLTAQSKEAGSEINHISVPLTGKAMEPPVHLHAGMSVIVKRTTGHPVPSYWNPIKFRSLSCRDRLLYCFKYIRFPHLQTKQKAPGFLRKSDALQLHILFFCRGDPPLTFPSLPVLPVSVQFAFRQLLQLVFFL